jgi:hypothetical protein
MRRNAHHLKELRRHSDPAREFHSGRRADRHGLESGADDAVEGRALRLEVAKRFERDLPEVHKPVRTVIRHGMKEQCSAHTGDDGHRGDPERQRRDDGR